MATSTDWVQAIASVIALVVAVCVAVWQAYTHHKQVKHQLFDKRYEVYKNVRSFIEAARTPLIPSAPKRFSDLMGLRMDHIEEAIEQSTFLFGKDVQVFVEQIVKAASVLKDVAAAPNDDCKPSDDEVSRNKEILKSSWLRCGEVFAPYLRLH